MQNHDGKIFPILWVWTELFICHWDKVYKSVEKLKCPKSHPVLTLLHQSTQRETVSSQEAPRKSSVLFQGLILTKPVHNIWVVLIPADFQSQNQQNQTVQNEDLELSLEENPFFWKIHWGHELKKIFDLSGISPFIPLFIIDLKLGFEMVLGQALVCHLSVPTSPKHQQVWKFGGNSKRYPVCAAEYEASPSILYGLSITQTGFQSLIPSMARTHLIPCSWVPSIGQGCWLEPSRDRLCWNKQIKEQVSFCKGFFIKPFHVYYQPRPEAFMKSGLLKHLQLFWSTLQLMGKSDRRDKNRQGEQDFVL